jgi:hypothetical protein
MRDNTNPQINAGQGHTPIQVEVNNERLLLGVIAGIIAAAIGAVVWALITYWTKFQIGWMAIGVGALVGVALRFLGKGSSIKFGIIGALLAVLGCLAGNFLVACINTARYYDISVFDVLPEVNMTIIIETIKQNFHVIDLLFYALAIYAGFKFSYKLPSTLRSGF